MLLFIVVAGGNDDDGGGGIFVVDEDDGDGATLAVVGGRRDVLLAAFGGGLPRPTQPADNCGYLLSQKITIFRVRLYQFSVMYVCYPGPSYWILLL